MVDIRQTVNYANYMTKCGWKVESSAGIYYYLKKIPLFGSVLKLQRPEEIKNNKIKELCSKHRVFYLIVEPKYPLDAILLTSLGYKQSKTTFSPSKTLQLDITSPVGNLIRGMNKHNRQLFRKEGTENILETSSEAFLNAWKKAVRNSRYVPSLNNLLSLKKSFKKKALFLMTADGSAGAIFLLADSIGYYWQAFTNEHGRETLAQSKIMLEGITWAKSHGVKIFDFEGIYDERFPNPSWKGFSHFKKSFGGETKEYPGCFIKYRLPF